MPRTVPRLAAVLVGRAENVTSTRAAPPNRWCRKLNLVCPPPRPISARFPATPVLSAMSVATPGRKEAWPGVVTPGAYRSTNCCTSSWSRLRCSVGGGSTETVLVPSPVSVSVTGVCRVPGPESSVTEVTAARPRVPSRT